MKNIPAALILEKNKLATANPWLVLLDIQLPDGETLYIVKNTEDVVFQGRNYTAFPFTIEATKETSKGEIPTVTLRISNITRIFQGYLEQLDGAIGAKVTLRVVNAAYLSEDFSELEMTFDVMSTSSDAQWIDFSLGAPNPLRSTFPPKRYMPESCNWEFGSVECGYNGPSSTCERTLDDCRLHVNFDGTTNSSRFGGFPGLSAKGIRFA